MNIVQLQDLLKGTPDARLQQEMSQPTGTIPQYLVLSEIVRRDKMRQSVQDTPKTTVAQDVMSQIPAPAIQQPQMQQQEQPQQEEGAPQGYASGGFISPASAMGNAGVRGFTPEAPKPPASMGGQTGGHGMFTPNTAPAAPAPVTNVNATITPPKPQFDGGQQTDFSSPSYYEQGAYADGGVIGLAKGGQANSDLASLIRREAEKLGISPEDLATAISYETGGTFDPAQPGPTTKWGKHIGLIQMGKPQREQYGYDPEGDLSSQMSAVGKYLKGHGVKPGMGMLDVYSSINAGAPGRGGASDVAAGGAPGTVAEKVANQMAGHRQKAAALLASQQGQGLAGRETTAGPGVGAGLAAIGSNPAQSYPTIASDTTGKTAAPSNIADYQSMSKDLGSALLKKSAPIEGPRPPDMVGGDPSLVAGIRRDPSQQIAEYIALRQQAGMASGGTVRMKDGETPDNAPELTDEEARDYLLNKQRLERLKGFGEDYVNTQKDILTTVPRIYGAAADKLGISGLVGAAIGDPRFHFTDPSTRESWTPYSDEAAKIKKENVTEEKPLREQMRQLKREEAIKAGQAAPFDPSISTPMDRSWTPPAQFTQPEVKADVFAETPAPEAPAKPTAEEDYISYLKQRDEKMNQLYDEQIKAEQERQSQASGLPAFLRQMGLGMLGSQGNLRSSIQEGLASAAGAREAQGTEGRDRLRELQLKRQAGGIESLGEIAKLKYENEIARQNAAIAAAQRLEILPKEYLPLAQTLIASLDNAYKAVAARDKENGTTTDAETDPAVIAAKAKLAQVSQKTGLGGTLDYTPQGLVQSQ